MGEDYNAGFKPGGEDIGGSDSGGGGGGEGHII
jgi:hypothetical protein